MLDIFVTHTAFTEWLVRQIIRRFGAPMGHRKSDSSLSLEAGLSRTRMFNILKGTARVTERDVEALSPYLGVSPDEFRRRSGVVPITTGTLTPEERQEYAAALRRVLAEIEGR